MRETEVLRRLVHVGLGGGAWLLPILGWELVAVLAALAVPFNLLALPRIPGLRRLERPGGRGRTGLVLYPLVVLALVVVFRERREVAQAGWLALAVGDGCAPLLGVWMSRPRWPWLQEKSVPASLVAFGLAGLCMLSLMPAAAAAAGAAGGLLGEVAPLPADDNLLVPMAAVLAVLII